jgi:hypothetical protein
MDPARPTPLTVTKIEAVAHDIRNVHSELGEFPSPVTPEAVVFASSPVRIDGARRFLAEPYATLKGRVVLERVALAYFTPVLADFGGRRRRALGPGGAWNARHEPKWWISRIAGSTLARGLPIPQGGRPAGESGGREDRAGGEPARAAPAGPAPARRRRRRMRTMRDLLRANGGVDVVSGVFSFYSEPGVKNHRVTGRVKPLFRDVQAYNPEKDRDKSFGAEVKERAIDLVENALLQGDPAGTPARGRAEAPAPSARIADGARRAGRLQQPMRVGVRDRFQPAVDPELAEEILDVVANGRRTDAETLGQHAGVRARGEELQDFALATRERFARPERQRRGRGGRRLRHRRFGRDGAEQVDRH